MESLTNSPPDRFNFVEKRFFSASLSENQIFQQNKYVKIGICWHFAEFSQSWKCLENLEREISGLEAEIQKLIVMPQFQM